MESLIPQLISYSEPVVVGFIGLLVMGTVIGVAFPAPMQGAMGMLLGKGEKGPDGPSAPAQHHVTVSLIDSGSPKEKHGS